LRLRDQFVPLIAVFSDGEHRMTISQTLYSSRSEEWPTPQQFFDALHREFRFTLDPCATAANAKCQKFFDKEHDGLARDWGRHRVFCNPPYGRAMSLWAHKCFEASRRGALVVLLAHARTDTRWFHDCQRHPFRPRSPEIR
jgi:site-specific DNA-methyltransferase (adenine-specific)